MIFSGAVLGIAGLLALTAARPAPPRAPFRAPTLGPLFRWELREQARRRLWFARLAYVGAVAVLLYGAAGASLDAAARPEKLAEVSERFVGLFLLAQLAAVTFLTPAVVAAAAARDRDRGTWELLLAAPLSGGELAAGKLAAGLGAVGSVLAAGWPLLALGALVGGADAGRVAGGLLVAAAALLASGGFALWRAVRGDGVVATVAWSTGFALLLSAAGIGFAPLAPLTTTLALLDPAADPTAPALLGALTQLLVAAVTWIAAVRTARPEPRRELSAAPGPARPARQVEPHRGPPIPPLADGDALLWKERHFRGATPGVDEIRLGVGALVLAAAAAGLGAWLAVGVAAALAGRPAAEWLFPPAAALFVGAGLLATAQGGLAGAACLARERQRQTLECLLALPWGRADVFRAKRRAAFEAAGPAGAFALAGGALALVAAESATAWLGALALGAAFLAASVLGGLWLSARTATAPAATVHWLAGWAVGVISVAASELQGEVGATTRWILAAVFAALALRLNAILRRRYADECEPILLSSPEVGKIPPTVALSGESC